MSLPLLDVRGTWDEIAPQLEAIRGRRIRLIVLPDDNAYSDQAHCSLDSALEEIWTTVPDTSWQQFAPDFAENLDHYLYGTPKRK